MSNEEAPEDDIKVFLFGGDDNRSNGELTFKNMIQEPPLNAEGSRQLLDDFDIMKQLTAREEILAPPYDPLLLAHQLEKSTRLQAIINAKAYNVAGHGWDIIAADDCSEQEMSPREQRAFKREKKRLKKFLDRPNEKMPLTHLLVRAKIDEESTGNGFIEFALENGKPKLFHVPSHTIRVLRGGTGYVQVRGGKTVYFKNFGDSAPMDYKTGSRENVDPENEANELLHLLIYSPRDSYYGIPPYVAASGAISGNYLASQRNVAFFDNDAVPRMAILVEGGSLSKISTEALRKFFARDTKGVENAHRTIVLEAAAKNLGTESVHPSIKIEKLTVGATDDASFQAYRQNNDEEIRETSRIHKVFIGSTNDTNRAGAIIGRQVTNEQVFAPDQDRIEYLLNFSLLPRLGFSRVKIKLKPPRAIDGIERAEIAKSYGNLGTLTINEIRRDLGLPALKYAWAELPPNMAAIQFAQAMGATAEVATVAAEEKIEENAEEASEEEGEDLESGAEEEIEMDKRYLSRAKDLIQQLMVSDDI